MTPQPMKPREDWPAIGADLFAVVVFAVIGRAIHEQSLGAGDIAWTALPFAAAALITHLVLYFRRIAVRSPKIGVVVWLGTWLLGMGLRVLTGAEAPIVFIAVGGLLLALMILMWRFALWLFGQESAA